MGQALTPQQTLQAAQRVDALRAQEENSNHPDNPEVAWWCKLLAKAAGVIGGGICALSGIWTVISTSPLCILAGILQIVVGAVTIMIEAPICCAYLDVTKPVASFAEKRTFFQKALIYCIAAIFPVAMCFALSSLVGCALVFATGVIYGLMALGKKADRETMMARAGGGPGTGQQFDDGQAGLVYNEGR